MRMIKFAGILGLVVAGWVMTPLAGTPAPANGHVSGQLVAVDTAAKKVALTNTEGTELEATYDDKTKFEAIRPGETSDIAAGKDVKIVGELAADDSAITAQVVEMLLADTKIPAAITKNQNFIVGKLEKDGENWTVAVKDKKIKVTLGDDVKVRVRENVKPEDAQTGEAVGVWLKNGVASRVQLPNRQG